MSAWRNDTVFRQDVTLAWDALRRHIAMLLLTVATLLAPIILCFSILHLITD